MLPPRVGVVMLADSASSVIERGCDDRAGLGWRARLGEEWGCKGGATGDVRMMSLESER